MQKRGKLWLRVRVRVLQRRICRLRFIDLCRHHVYHLVCNIQYDRKQFTNLPFSYIISFKQSISAVCAINEIIFRVTLVVPCVVRRESSHICADPTWIILPRDAYVQWDSAQNTRGVRKFSIFDKYLGSLMVIALDKYSDGWPTFGGQTTSVFHQATHANSSSYPQRDGKWVPAKVRRRSVAGVKGKYGSFHLWILDERVSGR